MKIGDRVGTHWRYFPHEYITGTIEGWAEGPRGSNYWIVALDKPLARNFNGITYVNDIIELEDNLDLL